MQVIVTGWRSSREDWLQAQKWPSEELPHLSDSQKAAAAELGVSEEDYARSAFAGELSRHELQAKARRFGEILQRIMRDKLADASVHSVELQTLEGKVRIVAFDGERELHFGVDEGLVDRLLESGSREPEINLERIVELSLPPSGAARAS